MSTGYSVTSERKMNEDEKKKELKKIQKKAYSAVLCAHDAENSKIGELKNVLKIKIKPVEKKRKTAYEAVVLALTLDTNRSINAAAVLANLKHEFEITEHFHEECHKRARKNEFYKEDTGSNNVGVLPSVRSVGNTNKLRFKFPPK